MGWLRVFWSSTGTYLRESLNVFAQSVPSSTALPFTIVLEDSNMDLTFSRIVVLVSTTPNDEVEFGPSAVSAANTAFCRFSSFRRFVDSFCAARALYARHSMHVNQMTVSTNTFGFRGVSVYIFLKSSHRVTY